MQASGSHLDLSRAPYLLMCYTVLNIFSEKLYLIWEVTELV